MARVASEKRPSRYKEQAQGLVKDIAWREEDGIVLIDQDRCRGWLYWATACMYQ